MISYCRRQRYQDSMQFFDHFANQEWIVERTVPSYHKKYLRYIQESCKDEINYLRELLTSDQLLKKVDIENSSMDVENEQSSPVESFIHNPFENHCVYGCINTYDIIALFIMFLLLVLVIVSWSICQLSLD